MRRSVAPLLAAAVVVSAACGLLASRDVAETAVDRFHQLFNEASYSVIYNEADPAFHRSTAVPDFKRLMQAVERDLGAFRQARRTGFRSDAGADGQLVTLTYESEFAEGRATEEFVFVTRDGEARLVSYDISSPLLKAP